MEWLWLVPTLPLAGFLILVVSQGRLPDALVAMVGAGSVGFSALVGLAATLDFVSSGSSPFTLTLWSWIDVAGFTPAFRLYLDGLSVVMMGVITGVGFLIHLYAVGYMRGEPGYARFFAYMNLFVFAMLMLVLGDNLLVLYLGWEGVGLCSYLLIGFYHTDPANGYAARKAFVVTRVGDTMLAIGFLLLFRELGSLDIIQVLSSARATWPEGSETCTLIALLLLGGAVGKSAQLPLQTWLPDAMAGPTPVSALIHAATMVTAGVYLIARMHDLYLLSPAAQQTVALVGLATLVIAAVTAMTQRDIKRILAYSTMSQIGYMFLALGVGAWSAAIFHLMTHAFFKALLFLSAGSVILALHHEQDIFKMGGLRRKLPVPFWCMVIGSAALAGLPLTSGYFSKDAILLASASGPQGNFRIWGIAGLAAFLTALYSSRMIYLTFFGETRTEPHSVSPVVMWLPLAALALLSVVGGWFGMPTLAAVLPDGGLDKAAHGGWLVWITALIPVVGAIAGYLIFGNRAWAADRFTASATGKRLNAFWASGWGFDRLYDAFVVTPFVRIARLNKADFVDQVYALIVTLARGAYRLAILTQTGRLRWYATNMALGMVVVLVVVLVAAT